MKLGASKPIPIRTASTVLLIRDDPHFQVLMVQRNYQIDFVPGALIFPGGKVEPSDSDPHWQTVVSGWNDVPEFERGPRIAAFRETFEEVGIIIGKSGASMDASDTLLARKAVEQDSQQFFRHVVENQITLDLTNLALFSRWLTPPVVPKRFDTYFYLATAPAGQVAISDGYENTDVEWIAPDDALVLASDKLRNILLPTRMNLQVLAKSPDTFAAISTATQRDCAVVEPIVEIRGSDRVLTLDPKHGYDHVEELFPTPFTPPQTRA